MFAEMTPDQVREIKSVIQVLPQRIALEKASEELSKVKKDDPQAKKLYEQRKAALDSFKKAQLQAVHSFRKQKSLPPLGKQ